MEGDYEKAKKDAFDDNLVLAGNTKQPADRMRNTVQNFDRRPSPEQIKKKQADSFKALGHIDNSENEDQQNKPKLPQDRRSYAKANESLKFKAMPPPLKCSAAQIFYKQHQNRQETRKEKEQREQLEDEME